MKEKNKKFRPSKTGLLRGTVFVALSGGVDSSVAALLLKKQGYYVVGVFMRCWREEIGLVDKPFGGYRDKSCAQKDAEDARKVAEQLEIPFYVWDFEKDYKKKVVDYMIDGYKRGITPNPDVMCNKEIKFGLFLEKALKMGADYIATGHYVRLRKSTIQNPKFETNPKSKTQNSKQLPAFYFSLLASKDTNKDQSYFLWTLTQEQLKHCLFPIGDYLKSEVREIAGKAGLPTANKKDSQGICFLGKVTLDEFLAKYIPEKKGEVLDMGGKKIGEHKGAHLYTIGQRHLGLKNYELRIRGRREIKPFYVAEKNIKTNTLIVAEGSDNPALYKKEVELVDVNFINPPKKCRSSNDRRKNNTFYSLIRTNGRIRGIRDRQTIIDVLARVRYRQPLVKARIMNYEAGIKGRPVIHNSKIMILKFDRPVKFVAPGQSAAFYSKKGELLGGGIIKE